MKKTGPSPYVPSSSSVFLSRGTYFSATTDQSKQFIAALFNDPKQGYYVQIGVSRNGHIQNNDVRFLEPGNAFLDNSGCLMKVISKELIELIDNKTGKCFGEHLYTSY